MKLIFKTLGETTSSIQDNSYLRKGNIFDKLETLNEDYIDKTIESMAIFTLKFKISGFFLLQANTLLFPFDEKSINTLSIINGSDSKEAILTKAFGNKTYIKQNYIINNKDKNNYYNFLLKNELGKTTECRVSDIEVYLV